jgi:hypothetical protein
MRTAQAALHRRKSVSMNHVVSSRSKALENRPWGFLSPVSDFVGLLFATVSFLTAWKVEGHTLVEKEGALAAQRWDALASLRECLDCQTVMVCGSVRKTMLEVQDVDSWCHIEYACQVLRLVKSKEQESKSSIWRLCRMPYGMAAGYKIWSNGCMSARLRHRAAAKSIDHLGAAGTFGLQEETSEL